MDTNNGHSLHAYTDKQRGVRPGRTVLFAFCQPLNQTGLCCCFQAAAQKSPPSSLQAQTCPPEPLSSLW